MQCGPIEEYRGLWVHSAQLPTGEYCELLDGLGAPAEHSVLPCNGYPTNGESEPIACRDLELLDGLNHVIADYQLRSPRVFDYEVGCQ